VTSFEDSGISQETQRQLIKKWQEFLDAKVKRDCVENRRIGGGCECTLKGDLSRDEFEDCWEEKRFKFLLFLF
jgi:hypothetical protein